MVSGLSTRIKRLRVSKGWTQERLALVAGLSYRTIQRIERDGHCSLDSKMALSAAFDITLNELSNEEQNVLNNIFDLTFVMDRQGVFKSVHSDKPELLYRPINEIIGKKYVDIMPSHVSKMVSKAIEKLSYGNKVIEFIYWLQFPAGKKYFNIKIVWADTESFLSVITEISQQKAKEQKLLKNEALLNLVADTQKAGGWQMDLVTMEIMWTKQVYAIYELDEIPAITESFNFYAELARPKIQQAFKNLVELGIPYDLVLPFVSAKGRKLWVRVAGLPLYANAEVISVSGTIQDVTQLKIPKEVGII